MYTFNADEQAAAAAISNIKRGLDDGADHAAGMMRPVKKARPSAHPVRQLKPAPYFYYIDHSMEADPDPLTPLTPPGRVPNFPAKMHAILSRKDFEDIVAWLPHGRSWRVLKPREFEIKVIPKFFEHAKFSSFVRQANGWGFRRITQGRDRNSYYHECFLRGLPHLCKTMKRPGVSEKKQADPDHEPDLYKISEEHPIPEKADDDSVMLHCTLQGGPKARMPIYWGSMASATTPSAPAAPAPVAPSDPAAVQTFLQPVVSTEQAGSPMSVSPVATIPKTMVTPMVTMPSPAAAQPHFMAAMANQMAFPMNPAAASQFAAGFAAATAFSQQHFSTIFSNLAAQKSMEQQQQQAAPQQQQQQQAAPQQQQTHQQPSC